LSGNKHVALENARRSRPQNLCEWTTKHLLTPKTGPYNYFVNWGYL